MKGMYGVDTMAKGNEKENRTEKLIRELPKGLLKWYPFHENSRTLFVADRTEQGEVLLEALAEYDMEVDCNLRMKSCWETALRRRSGTNILYW